MRIGRGAFRLGALALQLAHTVAICPCKDAALCQPLSPQPPPAAFEVMAFHAAPAYGANLSDWQKTYDFGVITTVASFAPHSPSLTCHAHAHGVRVIDGAGILSVGKNPLNNPEIITNATARATWVRLAVRYVVSVGYDGASLNIEALEGYAGTLTATGVALLRAGLVETVCDFRAALNAAVPGSLLTFNAAFWPSRYAPGSTPKHAATFDVYDYAGLAQCVDSLSLEAYCFSDAAAADPHQVATAQACAPLPALKTGFDSLVALGVPPRKLAPLLPWIGAEYVCDLRPNASKLPGAKANGRGCTTTAETAHLTVDQPGYGLALRMAKAANATVAFDEDQSIGWYDRTARDVKTGALTRHTQVFTETPRSATAKVGWASSAGAGGVAVWTADAVASVKDYYWGGGCAGDMRVPFCPQDVGQTVANARAMWAGVKAGVK